MRSQEAWLNGWLTPCEELKDGAAIFNEYREFLDEDSEGCGSDYDGYGAAYWFGSIWLKN